MKKIIAVVLLMTLVISCATSQTKSEEGAKKGAAVGAIGGAILGQLLGGNTKSTLIGAGIGVIAGAAVGQHYGKKADEQEAALRKQLADIEQAKVQREADILAVTFMSDLMFDVGSAELKPGAYKQIESVSNVLVKYTETSIEIAGHTDSTGSAAFNQQLSELRAKNVKLAFVEKGVHPSRIDTIGFGQTAPIADNNTEKGRNLNRRVVITISPGETS